MTSSRHRPYRVRGKASQYRYWVFLLHKSRLDRSPRQRYFHRQLDRESHGCKTPLLYYHCSSDIAVCCISTVMTNMNALGQLESPCGMISGTEASHCKINWLYHPDALLITLTCLITNPSGIGRCTLIGTAPILGSLICSPVKGLSLNCGNTNDRYCPNFLNLGNPKPRSFINLKALSRRLRASCKTCD